MECKSVQFVFNDESTVTFTRGSDKTYTGDNQRYRGKMYRYTVAIQNKKGRFTTETFYSPSQAIALVILNRYN